MLRALLIACLPLPALACEEPVCRVDPLSVELTRVIDFDRLASGWDPGQRIDETLQLDGASFAEHFAGQTLTADGDFDVVTGAALSPLTLMPGAPGQSLSIVHMLGSNILNGFGPAGFPRTNAQGEGAIAVLFDDDQPALGFEILGGEAGSATVLFLRRDGSLIHALTLNNLAREAVAFQRTDGTRDIAGIVITNADPQGLAIDNIRFGPPPQLG